MEIETILCVECGKRLKIVLTPNNNYEMGEKCNINYVPIKYNYIHSNNTQQIFESKIYLIVDFRKGFKFTKPIICKSTFIFKKNVVN